MNEFHFSSLISTGLQQSFENVRLNPAKQLNSRVWSSQYLKASWYFSWLTFIATFFPLFSAFISWRCDSELS